MPAKATEGMEPASKFSMATAFEGKEKNCHSWEILLVCVLIFHISGHAFRCGIHFCLIVDICNVDFCV